MLSASSSGDDALLGLRVVDPGRVHHDVEPTVLGDDPVDQRVDVRGGGDVHRLRATGPGVRRHGLRALDVHVGDVDRSAPLTVELADGSRADPGSTTGDQHDRAFEPTGGGSRHAVVPLLVRQQCRRYSEPN